MHFLRVGGRVLQRERELPAWQPSAGDVLMSTVSEQTLRRAQEGTRLLSAAYEAHLLCVADAGGARCCEG